MTQQTLKLMLQAESEVQRKTEPAIRFAHQFHTTVVEVVKNDIDCGYEPLFYSNNIPYELQLEAFIE